VTGFSSLNTAITGMSAAQRAMDAAGQNVVNANTDGYSRQRVDLASVGATSAATLYTGSTGNSIGGVTVETVERVRNAFLEGARANAGADLSALNARSSVMTGAEQLLSEPGDTGLQQVFDTFFSAWHDLAAHPQDEAAGAVVLQDGAAVADQIRSTAQGIGEQWTNSLEDLRSVVDQTNQASKDLAGLNETIRQGVSVGNPVNELMDKRDQLVRKLGELVGATAEPGADGGIQVTVNGITIVSGSTAQPLTLQGGTDITGAAGNPPKLMWQGTTVPVVSGAAGGLATALGSDLPNLSRDVDTMAMSMKDAVNQLHSSGFTLDGGAGGDFFSGTEALDLAVVPTSTSDLAVATVSGKVDGSNAGKIADLSDDRVATALLGGPGPSEQWRAIAATTGTTVQSLERSVEVQTSVVSTADDAVEADAGVNVDEEMTNMLLFQRAFQAAARVITTVDEMLDTLINKTGTVGR